MNSLKKIYGKIIYSIASLISFILDIIIGIIEIIVNIVVGIGRSVLALISMGGCMLIMLLGPALLFNPLTFTTIVFLIIFPILGKSFVSYIKYIKYILTEFLFDYADSLIKGKQSKAKFNDYGNKYRRMEEENRRREQEKRQEEQQRQWEERFKQWNQQQDYQRTNGGYGNFGGYSYGGQGGGYNQSYVNPNIEFKSKYEKSCDIIGVPYNSDKYQIKLGYRKKAKEYHPDINPSADATKIFQEINSAYEFLSDDNIERYKNIK